MGLVRATRLRVCLPFLILGVLAHAAGAQRPPDKLTIGIAAVSPGQIGMFVAKEAGFFRQQGLDVELVYIRSGTEAVQAVVAGQLPISTAAGPAVINAALAGADIAWVAGLLDTLPYVLIVKPDIDTPTALRGRRLGVNRFGASADFAARFALVRLGLDPRRDLMLVQVGDRAARLAALQAGSIDGMVTDLPFTLPARRLGFRELSNLSQLGLRYPAEGVAVSRALIRAEPDLVRRVLTAVVLGIHRFKTHHDEGITALGRFLRLDNAEDLAETYAAYAPLVSAKPYLTPEGVQLVLDELAREDPRARTARPGDFVEMRFVRELDESGFIDKLYR